MHATRQGAWRTLAAAAGPGAPVQNQQAVVQGAAGAAELGGKRLGAVVGVGDLGVGAEWGRGRRCCTADQGPPAPLCRCSATTSAGAAGRKIEIAKGQNPPPPSSWRQRRCCSALPRPGRSRGPARGTAARRRPPPTAGHRRTRCGCGVSRCIARRGDLVGGCPPRACPLHLLALPLCMRHACPPPRPASPCGAGPGAPASPRCAAWHRPTSSGFVISKSQ